GVGCGTLTIGQCLSERMEALLVVAAVTINGSCLQQGVGCAVAILVSFALFERSMKQLKGAVGSRLVQLVGTAQQGMYPLGVGSRSYWLRRLRRVAGGLFLASASVRQCQQE